MKLLGLGNRVELYRRTTSNGVKPRLKAEIMRRGSMEDIIALIFTLLSFLKTLGKGGKATLEAFNKAKTNAGIIRFS